MKLTVLLPFETFVEESDVVRVVAEKTDGSFGMLPRRLDCVAVLAPGILIYETESGGEKCLAVDEGALIKTGQDVFVSVRNAIPGTDLGQLRAAVEREFLSLDEQERSVRLALAKVEGEIIHRMATFRDGR